MESATLKKFRVFFRISIIAMSFLPFFLHAQDGQNDVSFNKPDKIAAQAANDAVEVSALQADNKLIIAGTFTRYNGVNVNKLARLKQDGSIDKSFNAGLGPNGKINAIAIQSNNKILIGGTFTNYNGVDVKGIARLNANGSIDNTFKPAIAANKGIFKILIQPDQKILVGVNYRDDYPVHALSLVRLNKNGGLDNSFFAAIDPLITIHQIALQGDGKIILAGDLLNKGFAYYCGAIRLNANGSKDHTFKNYIIDHGDNHQYINSIGVENNGNILLASVVYAEDRVYQGKVIRLDTDGNQIGYTSLFWINSLLIQKDGKIIVTGFKYENSDLLWYVLKRKIVRLNKDFTIDSTLAFDDKKIYSNAHAATIQTSTLQIDGKIVIGGGFNETAGLITNNLARIKADGSIDDTFNQHKGSNGTILATAVQGDEKIVIGGSFSRFNYQFISNIARLKKNGELDPSFVTGTGTNGRIHAIAVQLNGKILIGGSFTSYNGHACNNIAQLNKNGSFDESFGVTADNTVRKISIDRNGKIIIAGDFRKVNGVANTVIARILSNGQLDDTFKNGVILKPYFTVVGGSDFTISSRGQIYLAINYQSWVFQPYQAELLRLNRNGSVDSTFKIPGQLFSEIQTVTFNNDGKPIIGGSGFTEYRTYPGFVAQLNTNGNIDSSFDFQTLKSKLNNIVRTITVFENDKLIIGGDFSAVGDFNANHIALLNKDGSLDADFTENASNAIYTATKGTDNKLIIGGSFNEYSSVVRNGIARINIEIPDSRKRSQTLFIPAEAEEASLSVYPNPAASMIHIENLEAGIQLKIFNIMGKEMYTGIATTDRTTIQIADYANGIYFIIAENKGKRIVQKLIVNK